MKKLLAYLQLFRLPNVFTAVADVMMGYFITVGEPKMVLFWLTMASCSLYCAGMTLNDVMDYEADKDERPDRPLPSGRIELSWAKQLGYLLLALGAATAFGVSPWSGGVGLALAAAIYLYDGPLKRTPLAPWVMGSCRMLNVLLGMSLARPVLQPEHLMIAGGLGVYVAGITWFARCEAKDSDPKLLTFGFCVMALGIAMLGAFPLVSDRQLLFKSPILWPTLLVLLVSSVVRVCVSAIRNPTSDQVQRAVKHSLFTLIILDAAVVLALRGPQYALVVLLLIVPSKLLGRWVYST